MKHSFESEAHNNGLVNQLCMTFVSSMDTHLLFLNTSACTHSKAAHNTCQYARTLYDARWKEGMNKDVLCLHLHVYL